MIGCNIPLLFSKIQIYPFPFPKRPTQTWQVCLIDGVVLGVINTILYFAASLYPLSSAPTENETGQDEQGKEATEGIVKDGEETNDDGKNNEEVEEKDY